MSFTNVLNEYDVKCRLPIGTWEIIDYNLDTLFLFKHKFKLFILVLHNMYVLFFKNTYLLFLYYLKKNTKYKLNKMCLKIIIIITDVIIFYFIII